MKKYEEIEKTIIKKYRRDIWSKFIKAIKEYKLVSDNDKIMVCISGGKDSFLLAKCMEELKKHSQIKFDIEYVVMNPGYKKKNLNLIKKNAKTLNIPIQIFESNIFDVINNICHDKPCYMCARMRRGYLYNKAQELGCNKIALGHHFNDVIETTLLSLFYGAEIKTMMPKLHSENFKNLELIRPLYLIRETSIIAWAKYNNLEFLNCACSFTEKIKDDDSLSKRKEMKKLIEEMLKTNKDVDYNIYKALDNVNLNCVLGYSKDRNYKSFLDEYDKNGK